MNMNKLSPKWQLVELGNICHIVIGGTPKRKEQSLWKDGKHLWVKVGDLNNDIVVSTEELISDTGVANSSAKYIPPGSMLLSFKLSLGKVGIAGEGLYTNEAVAALIPKSGKRLLSEYLFFLFQQIDLADFAQDAGKGKTVNKQILEEIPIPVPPLPVQRAIVTILNQADAIRRKQLALRALTKKLSLSLYLDMFGSPVSNPKHWRIQPLNSVVDSIGGGTPSKKRQSYWNGQIPWVSPKDIKSDEIYEATDLITEDALEDSATHLIEPNNLIIVVRSGVLKHTFPVAINRIALTINQDLKALKVGETFTAEYLFMTFKLLEQHILAQYVRLGSTVHNIDGFKFFNLEIPIPPIALQESFSIVLITIWKDQNIIDSSLEGYEALYDSLLSSSFTGELTAEWEATHADLITAEVARLERRPQLALLSLVAQRQARRPDPVGVTSLMKYAFLAQQEGATLRQPVNHLYDFVPYRFGPFAKEVYADLEALEAAGWLTIRRASDDDPDAPERVDITLSPERRTEISQTIAELSAMEQADLAAVVAAYGDLAHNDLLDVVYEKYPTYAHRSRR